VQGRAGHTLVPVLVVVGTDEALARGDRSRRSLVCCICWRRTLLAVVVANNLTVVDDVFAIKNYGFAIKD
jgi:hypothetical protein